ncbi:MAG: hypothetical protein ACOC3D_09785 [Pseudomonadota bacterium]
MLALMPISLASAKMLYDELLDGDLPNDPVAAPLLQLAPGSNTIRTSTGGPNGFDPFDSYELVLPPGGTLESIIIVAFDPGAAGNRAFFTAAFSGGPGAFAGVGGLPVSAGDVGRDVLVAFEFAIQAQGLRFLLESPGGRAQLQADFVVTPIPAAVGLFATGLAALGAARWRRRARGASKGG